MRVEHIGDATLYLGDSVEVIKTVGDFDAIVTDPPYGIGFKYSVRYKDEGGLAYSRLIGSIKGKPTALLQYPEEMMRLVCPVLGAPDECLAWVYPSNLPRQFRLWGLWDLEADFSEVKQPAKNPESRKVKSLYVDSYDWFEQSQVKNVSAEKHDHPCQIPVSSVERVIRLIKKDTILDPFMGSGTCGVACANLGKRFIGIEIEPKYFEIACERISAAYEQERLFA